MKGHVNFFKVSYFSFCILVLYIAFNSTNNIEASLIRKDGYRHLGFILLALLYLFMAFGSILSTAVINKFGVRFGLMVGGIGCAISIFMTLLPVY